MGSIFLITHQFIANRTPSRMVRQVRKCMRNGPWYAEEVTGLINLAIKVLNTFLTLHSVAFLDYSAGIYNINTLCVEHSEVAVRIFGRLQNDDGNV